VIVTAPYHLPHGRTYRVDDFLDDQQRIISASRRRSSALKTTVEVIDGRLGLVYTDRLRSALEREECIKAFGEKYGVGSRAAHHCRFLRVIDFLERCHEQIVDCDLGAEEQGLLKIREELLGFLLNYDIGPETAEIPASALGQFLDQWGHRWM
jgi:hypothetical protein